MRRYPVLPLLLVPKPLLLPVNFLADGEKPANSPQSLIYDDDLTPNEDKDKREKEKIDDPKKISKFYHAGSLNLYRA
jgi:hypothetical protein